MKKFLTFVLAMAFLLSFASCTADLEDIAREDFSLDEGNAVSDYNCNIGLSQLGDNIANIYQDDENLMEWGRDVVDAIVEFDDAVLFSDNTLSFPTRMFYYALVETKNTELGYFLYNNPSAEEERIYWNSLLPDLTVTRKENVLDSALSFAKYSMATQYAIKDYEGYTSGTTDVSTYESLLQGFGNNVAALEEYYYAYGLNSQTLKDFLKFQMDYLDFKEYLVGYGGVFWPSDEELEAYFNDKCVYMQQIVFSYVYQDSYGCTLYKPEEEIAKVRAEGQKVYGKIVNDPKQFERNLYRSDMTNWTDNAAGYFYTDSEILPELSAAYDTLMPGEITAVETPLGYYIIRAVDKTQALYDSNEDRISTELCNEIYHGVMEKYFDNFTFDEAQFKRYDFEDILTY